MSLSGTYDRNLDAKGRLSLPPAFRKEFGDQVRVLAAPEKEIDAMYVFTKDAFEDWVMSVFEAKGGFDPTNKQHRLVKEGLYGVATTLDIDSAARISLHLDREVTIVGNDDRLVVWDRSKHLARKAETKAALEDFFN